MNRYAIPLLFILALLPRALAPGEFVTVDEAYHWFERAGRFLLALQQGDYAATNLIGHPGVTTMWLGAVGVLLHQAQSGTVLVPERLASDPAAYGLLRLPVAIATALSVALAFPMLRRLFGARVAWLTGLLWASEPFLVAHSRILHVDALLTSAMALALLAALLAFGLDDADQPDSAPQRGGVQWGWLVASAVAGGLALLTKSPSVLLPPLVGLIGLVGLVRLVRPGRLPIGALVRSLALALVVWAGFAAIVWLALWPAAWVDLPGAIERVVVQVLYEGGSPHGWGNFFMGRAVEDPGPFFYPVAVAFRLTPWTLLGSLAGVGFLAARGRRLPGWRSVALLGCFVLLFVAALSLSPKKFDRYALPIFPALTILAAVGLAQLWGCLAHTRHQVRPWEQRAALLFPVLLGALALGNLLWYHPYELAYYNTLAGGGPAAARVLPVGWGEGLGQAGRYIAARWNGCDRPVASWFAPALEPFACTPVVGLDQALVPGRVDYAVLYIDQMQRGNAPEASAHLRGLVPVHTVYLHGIAYARVYQLPLPLEHTPAADFGPTIRLHSYRVDTAAVRSSGVLTLTTQWQARAAGPPVDRDYILFVHLLDPAGRTLAQADVPPAGPRAPAHTWRAGHLFTWYHPLPVAADLPPGSYWLALGLYDPQDGQRLPLQHPPTRQPAHAPDDGPGALVLPLELP